MNNEKDIFYTIVEKAKEIGLTERERTTLFKAVDTYVARNPIAVQTTPETKTVSPTNAPAGVPKSNGFGTLAFPSFVSSWNTFGLRASFAFVVVLLVGAGTSFAAQSTLPGDLLYPVRININEGVKAAFLTGVDRSQFEIERVQRRISEVRQLAAKDQLSPDIQTKIAMRLNSHVASVQKDVDELNKKGDYKAAFEISSDLEKTLKQEDMAVTAGTLAVATQNETSAVQADIAVDDIIREPYEASVTARKNIEDHIVARNTNDEDTMTIALAKFETVQNSLAIIDKEIAENPSVANSQSPKLMMAKSFSAVATTSLSANATNTSEIMPQGTDSDASLSQRIDTARQLFEDGQLKLENKEYADAFTLFKEAYDITTAIQSEITPDVIDDGSTIHSTTDIQSNNTDLDADSDTKINLTNDIKESSVHIKKNSLKTDVSSTPAA